MTGDRGSRESETAIPSYRRHQESNLIPLITTQEEIILSVRYSRSIYQVQLPIQKSGSDHGGRPLCRAPPCMISVGRPYAGSRPCVSSALCNIGQIICPAESSFIRETVWARRHGYLVQCGNLTEEKMHLRSPVW